MKLVVGLGNPGPRYEGTRHNIGFDVLRHVAGSAGIPLGERRFGGQVGQGRLEPLERETCADPDAGAVLLLLPETFMNRSGAAVASALSAHPGIDPEGDLLVVLDDLDLPLGRLRIRPAGSAGGHNGLADVLHALGTPTIPRLRFGIGRPEARGDPIDFVLGAWQEAEREPVAQAVERAAAAVRCFVLQGIEAAMGGFNREFDPRA